MATSRDEGPVYYREIQKNAYLKRIPNDVSGSKLRPLSNKKVPLKPMWTQFCVHNGRTPYLEQYPDAESPATVCHAPVWRACLRSARHVTASVKPHTGDQYDFLVDTDNGAVRMLAPDWETMQDWVTTLRNTLHELKIMGKGENVYCAAPAAPTPPAPRAAARDPTSPLPPTPPIPPDRVPGIELTPNVRPTQPEAAYRTTESTTRPNEPTTRQIESTTRPIETTTRPIESTIRPTNEPNIPEIPSFEAIENEPEDVDISNWDTPFSSLPSTSQASKAKRGVTKICGQNICLDDSLFQRSTTGSDEEFCAEMDLLDLEENDYKQRVLVSNEEKGDASSESSNHTSNITVIQVSNKEPPHTAIPVMGPEIDVFDFEFKQNFVNIVNTEQNEYGTTFQNDSDYGHLSLTTTVSLPFTEPNFPSQTFVNPVSTHSESNPNLQSFESTMPTQNEELYERLCLASTSSSKPSPLPVKKLKNLDITRKSSLPNLEVGDSTYEYLFLSNNNSNTVNHASSNTLNPATSNSANHTPSNPANHTTNNHANHTTSNPANHTTSNPANHTISNPANHTTSNPANHTTSHTVNYTPSNIANHSNTMNSNEVNCNGDTNRTNMVQVASSNDPLNRLRTVERSRSQNAFDVSPRPRDNTRRTQNNSPKWEIKNQTTETQTQNKPIWKRGLTELSLLSLTRLRSIKQKDSKKRESPTRNGAENHQDRNLVSVKVVHRSRADNRMDTSRRRSSSLSNGQSPPVASSLTPLRARQAAALQAEQRRGAALAATIPVRDAPVFADYDNQVWIAWWGGAGARLCGRGGDRVAALRGRPARDAAHARQLLQAGRGPSVDILFHRVPLGKIYVINKRDQETLGLKLDNECNIVSVESGGPCARAALPPPGAWALTEINNRPLNLLKGGEDDMNRLSRHGTEVSVLIQPSALVKKLRAALKGNKTLLGLR